MSEVGFGELVVRMLVSLTVVLALVGGAYVVMRRRQGFGGAGRSVGTGRPQRAPRAVTALLRPGRRHALTGRHGGGRSTVRVVSRTGISRSTTVVAVQFADRVLLVGASDHAAPTVLAEVDLVEWARAIDRQSVDAPRHDDVVVVPDREVGAPTGPLPTVALRPTSLLDALREATARRG